MTERKSASERTAELLAAAERVLSRRGRVTVSAITAEAGIASGTFYLYFPSKAHLEAVLIERFIRGSVAEAERAMGSADDHLARFQATLSAIVRHATDHRAVLRLQETHTPTVATREIVANGVDSLRDLLSSALREGTEAGAFAVEDPEMTAALLYHGLEGVLRDAVAFGRELDEDRLVDAVGQHARVLLTAKAPVS